MRNPLNPSSSTGHLLLKASTGHSMERPGPDGTPLHQDCPEVRERSHLDPVILQPSRTATAESPVRTSPNLNQMAPTPGGRSLRNDQPCPLPWGASRSGATLQADQGVPAAVPAPAQYPAQVPHSVVVQRCWRHARQEFETAECEYAALPPEDAVPTRAAARP